MPGECLITRRALSKKAWPGVWTNSVCGHPQSGEETTQAVIRRCRFEVGAEITDITPSHRSFVIGNLIHPGSLKTRFARYSQPASRTM
jgi:isopentenyl-diphosphate delta-isomerase